MTYASVVERRGKVTFPEFTGERIYMRKFYDTLPADLARWQTTVDAMMAGINTDRPKYLMIDQKSVKAGRMHRRPAVHVDGWWIEGDQMHHGAPVPHHSVPTRTLPSHRHEPIAPSHHRVPVPHHSVPVQPTPGRHSSLVGNRHHTHAMEMDYPEAILLAADVQACRAFVGDWDGEVLPDGDCSLVDVSGLDVVQMEAGSCWAGNALMLHESTPVPVDCDRTLVRINVPGWEPCR